MGEILEWEEMHLHKCEDPSLLRFVGKSEEYSWKALFMSTFTHRARGLPFDRHDWTVDRCGLAQVRYIIDYYDDPNAVDKDLEITLDTRPALDRWENAWDRIRFPFWQWMNRDKVKSFVHSEGKASKADLGH